MYAHIVCNSGDIWEVYMLINGRDAATLKECLLQSLAGYSLQGGKIVIVGTVGDYLVIRKGSANDSPEYVRVFPPRHFEVFPEVLKGNEVKIRVQCLARINGKYRYKILEDKREQVKNSLKQAVKVLKDRKTA